VALAVPLIVFIDDATNCLTALNFAPSETTRAYLEALRDHVLEPGCPLAFYSDRHGIFRVNAKDAKSGDGKTEFGHVAERREIGVPIVCDSRRNSIFDQLTADPESTYRLPPGVRFFKGFSRGYF
jgi:hypothetical protein